MTDQPLEPEDSVEPEPNAPKPAQDTVTEPTTPSESPPPPPTSRRLYRSRDDRVVAGVCGGLGEYFDIDSTLFRIGFVLLVFAGGAGILAYVLAWLFIPEAPATAGDGPGTAPATPPGERTSGALLVGLAFVVLGAFFLFDEIWPDFLSWKYVWPIALIAVGVAVLARERR